MKLNSAAEMMPVSWREFSLLHPFAPKDQTKGYDEMITDLCQKLCLITGYDAISCNQILVLKGICRITTIRSYHKSRNQENRDICLISESVMELIQLLHKW